MQSKNFNKNQADFGKRAGFTLTEVMISIMILTVAIVAGSNLLMSLVRSNYNNLNTLQAYYLAVEGLEAVRNIRDSNWLNNRDWLGDKSGQPWGTKFELSVGEEVKNYAVELNPESFNQGLAGSSGNSLTLISHVAPWKVVAEDGEVVKMLGDSESGSIPFSRTVSFKKYDCKKELNCSEEQQSDYVLVESKVSWKLGAQEREVVLSEVFTDWKGGAL